MVLKPKIWLEPTRKVSRKSTVNYRAHHVSPLTRTQHLSESLNEHFACFHLDRLPGISTYVSNPCTFGYYNAQGKPRRYTPDKLIIRDDGQWVFLEIKPKDVWVKIKWQLKLKYIRAVLHSIGCHFHVMLDTEIKREPLLSNLRLFHAYAMLQATDEQKASVVQAVNSGAASTIEEAAHLNTGHEAPYALVYHLLYHKRIRCNFESELIEQTSAIFA